MEYRGTVRVETDDGSIRNVAILDKVDTPYHVKGFTDKVSFVAISKYLKDLKGKVKKPKLYVLIHEFGHVIHLGYGERKTGNGRIMFTTA